MEQCKARSRAGVGGPGCALGVLRLVLQVLEVAVQDAAQQPVRLARPVERCAPPAARTQPPASVQAARPRRVQTRPRRSTGMREEAASVQPASTAAGSAGRTEAR